MNRIFELPSSTPAAFLHLELGTLPIRFILMLRRLNFLQYILQEDKDSLMHSFLMAQIEDTVNGDWWETVKQDMVDLNLDMTLFEIMKMSEESYKSKVKACVTKAAYKWLIEQKLKSKKIKNIHFAQLKMQNHLTSQNLSVSQRKFLIHLRCKMVKVRTNYSKMYDSKYCQLCSPSTQNDESSEDSQEHLLLCPSLSANDEAIKQNTHYTDIFSEDISKQEYVTLILENKFKLRQKLEKKK